MILPRISSNHYSIHGRAGFCNGDSFPSRDYLINCGLLLTFVYQITAAVICILWLMALAKILLDIVKSVAASVMSLLLISGNVERNPGPRGTLCFIN